MNRKRWTALAVLSALGLGAAGGVYASNQVPAIGGPQSVLAGAMGHSWHDRGHGRGHYGRHGGHHGGPGHLCAGARGEKLEHAIDFVEGFVAFTPEQEIAWQDFTVSLMTGRERVRAACDELEQAEDPLNAPDALARAESLLTAGLEVVREVRPAFDTFYGTLSEDQKKSLDQLVNRHRRS